MCLSFPSRQPYRSPRRLNRATDIKTTGRKLNRATDIKTTGRKLNRATDIKTTGRKLNRATDIKTTGRKINSKQNRSYIWRQNTLHIVAKGKSFKNGLFCLERSEEQVHFQPSCWRHVHNQNQRLAVIPAENLKGNETCITQYHTHTHWPYKFLVRRTSISSNVNNGHLAA